MERPLALDILWHLPHTKAMEVAEHLGAHPPSKGKGLCGGGRPFGASGKPGSWEGSRGVPCSIGVCVSLQATGRRIEGVVEGAAHLACLQRPRLRPNVSRERRLAGCHLARGSSRRFSASCNCIRIERSELRFSSPSRSVLGAATRY